MSTCSPSAWVIMYAVAADWIFFSSTETSVLKKIRDPPSSQLSHKSTNKCPVDERFKGIINEASTDLRIMTPLLQSIMAPSFSRLLIPKRSGTPGASRVKAPSEIW